MNKIRKIIQEKVHVVLEIKEIVKKLAPYYMKEFYKMVPNIIEYKQKTYWTTIPVSELYLSNNAFVNELMITIYFHKESTENVENIVSGQFSEESIDQEIVDGIVKYNGAINLRIHNWDYKTNLEEHLKSVFSHELHHFFDDIVTFNKKKTTKILNSVNRMTSNFSLELLNKYPTLKDFTEIFYLNLPKERNARLTQLSVEADKYKGKPIDFVIEQLGHLTAFKDFQRMDKFDANNLKNIPYNDRKQFIDSFNLSLNYSKNTMNISSEDQNYPKEPDKFFEFWQRQFNKNAKVLFKKSINIAKFLSKEKINENHINLLETKLNSTSLEILFNYGLDNIGIEKNTHSDRIKFK